MGASAFHAGPQTQHSSPLAEGYQYTLPPIPQGPKIDRVTETPDGGKYILFDDVRVKVPQVSWTVPSDHRGHKGGDSSGR